MSKTPMEKQYESIKEKHHDKILLFRLGDFYEIFDEDAHIASGILNIAITKRHDKVMCGFPYHTLEQYSYKLVEAGHKVAICEQVEDPAHAKGIVKREVVSILTKGTWTENPLLDHSINSFLSVIVFEAGELSMIFSDLLTGEIILRSYKDEHPLSFMLDELNRFSPVETLVPENLLIHFPIEEEVKIYQNALRIFPTAYFEKNTMCEEYLNIHKIKLTPAREKALSGLFRYLEENHFNQDNVRHLKAPFEYQDRDTLFMNEDTLKHLELIRNGQDLSPKNSLYHVLNRTNTLPASRKLRRLLAVPSANVQDIRNQLARTEFFFNLPVITGLSELLKGMSDLERLAARLITGKILPRECLALADAIQRSAKLKDFLAKADPYLHYLAALKPFDDVVQKIFTHIHPDCSNNFNGNIFLRNVSQKLDELRDILNNSKTFLIKLQAEERINTGIQTLKISFNKVYGYYIEVSKAASKNVPEHYIRKQSLVNNERFTIPALENYEQKMAHAENSVFTLERELYMQLVSELQVYYNDLLPLAEFVTEVDLRLSLALVAKDHRYVKPTITDSFNWSITNGRHPVVEFLLKKEVFVSNNTEMNKDARILIVTGPNMAGKSTYLRQNALFAVMAQIGSYIPAKQASIGIVDKIFTRIGAADDLSAGRSTFFVEMEEAAFIIKHATPKSLIIMDELGRGTSTQDGLALAWAILEHFVYQSSKKAKILFSTHYHELTELEQLDGIKNLCMAVKESEGKPIFLRQVIDGQAMKSYGIDVAEMAGMDISVVKRATEILNMIEQGTFFVNQQEQSTSKQPTLFAIENSDNHQKDLLYQAVRNLNPNTLSPLDALNEIFKLINLLK